METHKIYKLIDPITLEIRYIGYTSQELYIRLARHIASILKTKNDNLSTNGLWLQSLLKQNKIPIIKMVKEVTAVDWEKWEIFYIEKHKKLGHNLTNTRLGGRGRNSGIKWTERQRELMTGINHPRAKRIMGTHLITGEITKFNSITEAYKCLIAKGIRVSSRNINACLKKKPHLSKHRKNPRIRKSAGLHTWSYQEIQPNP